MTVIYTVKIVEVDTRDEKTKFLDRGAYDVPALIEDLNGAGERAKDEAMKSPAYQHEIAGRIMLRVKAITLKAKPDDLIIDVQAPSRPSGVVVESNSEAEQDDEALLLDAEN